MHNEYIPLPVVVTSMFFNGHVVITHCTATIRNEATDVITTTIKEEKIAEIVDLYSNQEQRVAAIKEFRNVSGWYLKESKEAVEHLTDKFCATIVRTFTLEYK